MPFRPPCKRCKQYKRVLLRTLLMSLTLVALQWHQPKQHHNASARRVSRPSNTAVPVRDVRVGPWPRRSASLRGPSQCEFCTCGSRSNCSKPSSLFTCRYLTCNAFRELPTGIFDALSPSLLSVSIDGVSPERRCTTSLSVCWLQLSLSGSDQLSSLPFQVDRLPEYFYDTDDPSNCSSVFSL